MKTEIDFLKSKDRRLAKAAASGTGASYPDPAHVNCAAACAKKMVQFWS